MNKKNGNAKRAVKDLTAKSAASVKGGAASPVLLKACATGEHIKEATITV